MCIADAERVKLHSAIAYTREVSHEKVYSSVGYGSTGQASTEGYRYGRAHFSPALVRFIILAARNLFEHGSIHKPPYSRSNTSVTEAPQLYHSDVARRGPPRVSLLLHNHYSQFIGGLIFSDVGD